MNEAIDSFCNRGGNSSRKALKNAFSTVFFFQQTRLSRKPSGSRFSSLSVQIFWPALTGKLREKMIDNFILKAFFYMDMRTLLITATCQRAVRRDATANSHQIRSPP